MWVTEGERSTLIGEQTQTEVGQRAGPTLRTSGGDCQGLKEHPDHSACFRLISYL